MNFFDDRVDALRELELISAALFLDAVSEHLLNKEVARAIFGKEFCLRDRNFELDKVGLGRVDHVGGLALKCRPLGLLSILLELFFLCFRFSTIFLLLGKLHDDALLARTNQHLVSAMSEG